MSSPMVDTILVRAQNIGLLIESLTVKTNPAGIYWEQELYCKDDLRYAHFYHFLKL